MAARFACVVAVADEPFLRALVVLLRAFDLVVAFALLDFGLGPFVLRALARVAFAFGLAVGRFVLATVAPFYELTRLALNAGTVAAVGVLADGLLLLPYLAGEDCQRAFYVCFVG